MPRFSLSPIRNHYKYNEDDDDDDDDSSQSSSSSDDSTVDESDYPHPLGFGRTRFGLFNYRDGDSNGDSDSDSNGDSNGDSHSDNDEAPVPVPAPVPKLAPSYRLQKSIQTKTLLKNYYKPSIRPIENIDERIYTSTGTSSSRSRSRSSSRSRSRFEKENELNPALITNMDRIAFFVRGASKQSNRTNQLNEHRSTTSATAATPAIMDNNNDYIKASIIPFSTTLSRTPKPSSSSSLSLSSPLVKMIQNASIEYETQQQKQKAEYENYKKQIEQQQQKEAYALLHTIHKLEHEANTILHQEEMVERQIRDDEIRKIQLKEEEERKIQLVKEEEERKIQLIRERKEEVQRQKVAALTKVEEERRVREEERAALNAKKYAYRTEATDLVKWLDNEFRCVVQPFDKHGDKGVKKRRLNMKKIARGKMNTLSHDRVKIQSVVQDIVQAIQFSVQEDEGIQTQISNNNNNHGFTADMAVGGKYLIDLIASSLVVRVQAEGFNGTRGDGFPLAHMLAQVSMHLQTTDFVKAIMAHIYAVCPTVIPTLPAPKPGCSEKDLMESLGMQKQKNGEYETFPRFLARTEGIVSLVAEIMCSVPSDHVMFGGSNAAILWLQRFLDLLPEDQTPLPILTAPVLVAFLTAAGHMLANSFAAEFQPILDSITNDISKRLDDTPLGQPSATRLNKLLSGGIDEFKATLPPGCVQEFYDFGNTSSTNLSTNNKVNAPAQSSNAAASSIFGNSNMNTNVPNPSPFGSNSDNNANSTINPSPFGNNNNNSNAQNTTSFGMDSSTTAPFATNNNNNTAQNQNPFGMNSSTGASPFGMNVAQNTSGTLGATNANPFGNPTSAFSTNTAQNSAAIPASDPFGNNNAQVCTTIPAPNLFGNNNAQNSTMTPTPAPFGINNAQQSTAFSSPFGKNNQGTTSTFGNSPFGTNNTQAPFGGTTNTMNNANPSPFGNTNTQPAANPFGNNTLQKTANPSPFGNNTNTNINSFAGNPSPFGNSNNQNQVTNPSPFGNNTASNSMKQSPFGGGSSQQFANPSPFGGNSNQPSQQYGNNNNNSNKGSSKAKPCKFFLQGRCRFGANCKFSHDPALLNAQSSNGYNNNKNNNNAFSRRW